MERVSEYLEYRVQCNKDRRVLGIALRQLVPDENHGDATRASSENETYSKFWKIGEKNPGGTEHWRGPTIKFKPSEVANIDLDSGLRVSSDSFSYFTLANGGYIIRIRPMAIGIDTVLTPSELRKSAKPGTTTPNPTPMNIARKIQSVS